MDMNDEYKEARIRDDHELFRSDSLVFTSRVRKVIIINSSYNFQSLDQKSVYLSFDTYRNFS